MACQSGIRASDKLLRFFNECKSGKIRLAKIVVKNEELCVNFQGKGTTDWRADFKRHLPDCIDAFEPCYILFRIDEPCGWILMSFADDRAPVREKMVFAATWTTFKSEFGQSNIRYEYHVTDKKEMTLEAFEKWLSSKEDPGPMSELEKEFYNAHQELKVTAPSVVAAQTVRGVFFPVDQDAEEELRKLANHTVNYVQLAVDTLNEAIKLECSKISISPEELNEVIPRDKPRYHFYRFSHEYNSQNYDSLFFIYSMPSSGCTIKERMLYSSCKQPFLQSALSAANLSPDKKIEIDSKEFLSLDILIDYTHPAPQMKEKSFAKPPGPSQRGARRVTKAVG
ncbi:Uncharacterized protein BM_BM3918 [Brugia malayi]|uniref:Twinfilin n=2 Tax=Brugia malayi TaxID=6279 RepID=A0A0K0JCE5_BRUMA|nr:Uncharacterized protein BM_BM3918 [Brugia malayi]CTP80680.1 Bm3918 [Brugia malayi]VIO87689.1 Uncharacterized protein BM_BM3918 [Brugia malayi]